MRRRGAVRPATEKMYVADGLLPSFRRQIISTLPTFDREAHREVLPHHVNVIRLIRLTLSECPLPPIIADIRIHRHIALMQPFGFAIAILLVLTLMCVIGAAVMFTVASAFYALTVLSDVDFVAFPNSRKHYHRGSG